MGHRCQQVHLGAVGVDRAADCLAIDRDSHQVLGYGQVRPSVLI
jgi:hypothetical protein